MYFSPLGLYGYDVEVDVYWNLNPPRALAYGLAWWIIARGWVPNPCG